MRENIRKSIVIICKIWYNIISVVMGVIMDKEVWLKRRNIKILRRISRQKSIKKQHGIEENHKNLSIHENNDDIHYSKYKRNRYTFSAPDIFSIDDNPELTIKFFNDIIKRKNSKKFGATFYIEVSKVTKIDIEALMYIIAILNDTKYNSKWNYKYSGNFPNDGNSKRIFIESGFLSYVKSDMKKIVPASNKIRIIDGKFNDNEVARKICIFVREICKLNSIETRPLYSFIIELMGNTKDHAYNDNKNNLSANSWYLYAEESEDYIHFVFLDTGVGIPQTVYKQWHEKFLKPKNDSELIYSALIGEFRTETKVKYRGRGLPQINDCCQIGLLKDVVIYSGTGCCKIEYNEKKLGYEYVLNENKNRIFGTLFKWKIMKTK
jgi:hypothetical protein